MDTSDFCNKIRAEKPKTTYAALETQYRVNRWYLWQFIHRDDYRPPAKIAAALGIQVYEPAPVCLKCGKLHPLVKSCKAAPRRRTRAWSDTPIAEMPAELLRWKLDNREVIE